MISQAHLEKLDERIRQLKEAAQAVNEMGNGFPAIRRNSARILASVKMLELNVSDLVRLTEEVPK